MAYAANNAGPTSECTEPFITPASRTGRRLAAWAVDLSGCDSRPGVVDDVASGDRRVQRQVVPRLSHRRREGRRTLSPHCRDRRLEWDDSVSPPRIKKVMPTSGAPPTSRPNIASHARIRRRTCRFPFSTGCGGERRHRARDAAAARHVGHWSRNNPPRSGSCISGTQPETLNGSRIHFWGDHAAGASVGVAPPEAWHLEYRDGPRGSRSPRESRIRAPLDADNRSEFYPVTTRCLRAVFDASSDGTSFAAVAVQEWEVYSTRARPPRRPSVKAAATPNCSR